MDLIILLASAIAPALIIIFLVYRSDKYDKEPIPLLILSFFLGLISVAITLIISRFYSLFFPTQGNDVIIFFHAVFGVGLVEEFSKFIVLRYLIFNRRAFNEPFDGIIYAVMVSMGFATLENILYVYEGGLQVALARAVTAVPGHAAFAVVMGYYVGAAKFSFKKRRIRLFIYGLTAATLSHGLYDFFLMQQSNPGWYIISMAILAVTFYFSFRAIKIRQRFSPFRKQMRDRSSGGGRSSRGES